MSKPEDERTGTARSFGFLRRSDLDAKYTVRLQQNVEIWESPNGEFYAWPHGCGEKAQVSRTSDVTAGPGGRIGYTYHPQVP